MPTRPQKPCITPGCEHMGAPGQSRCTQCGTRARAGSDRRRGSAARRGYGHKHRTTFRQGVLTRDRICVACRRAEATEADHYPLSRIQLIAKGMDPDDPKRGRGLCHPCHSKATAAAPDQAGGWNAWHL